MLEDWSGAKAESDLTKTQILRLIMNSKNLLQLNIQTSSCVYK